VAGKVRSPGLPLEALALGRETGVPARESRESHACLGGIIDVVGQGARRTGKHTLKPVTGEIAGLGAGLDMRNADADAVLEISEANCIDWAYLDALATLDAGGQKRMLIEPALQCAGWAQSRVCAS
jgi:hypothetical protein